MGRDRAVVWVFQHSMLETLKLVSRKFKCQSLVGRCRSILVIFTKFTQLRGMIWVVESHREPRLSPEMNVSGWVGIRNVQVYCLTPTERRERARWSRKQIGKNPENPRILDAPGRKPQNPVQNVAKFQTTLRVLCIFFVRLEPSVWHKKWILGTLLYLICP